MKAKFYSIRTCFLLAFLAIGLGQSARAQSIVKAINNVTTGGDGTIALRGEVLRYFIRVTCGAQESMSDAMVDDDIPAGTIYEPNTTTLNGVAVPDVNGAMPFTGGGQINSAGSLPGECASNTVTTVIFRVRVMATAGTITNRARVSGNNFNQFTNTIFTNVQSDAGCNQVYLSLGNTVGNKTLYNQLRTSNTTTGGLGATLYTGRTGPCEDISGNVLPSGSLFTNASAMAFDQIRRRIYFVNDDITTPQNLGYIDMNRTPLTAVDFGVLLETATGAGYNITSMATGTNGNFYALTSNNLDFISFNFNAGILPTISQNGALINDASNGMHDILAEASGDLVCDGKGKVYLVTETNNIYAIDPATRIAKFLNPITGISVVGSNPKTTSAAIDNNGKLYVNGTYGKLYQVSLVNFTATQVGTALTNGVGDYTTCGLPIEVLRVATNEKQNVNNPVVALTSEVYAKVQPNPFHDQLNLQVQLNTTEQVRVQLIDFFGRTVYTTSEKMSAGVNSLQLAVPANLGAGIYVVELWTGDKRLLQKKIVKQ